MKRCWIHIGMHKTGSSSVQQTLGSIEEPEGWRYVKLGNYKNLGTPLSAMFRENADQYHRFATMGLSPEKVLARGEKWRQELKTILTESPVENFVLSAEAISSMPEDAVQRLHDFIAPLVDE